VAHPGTFSDLIANIEELEQISRLSGPFQAPSEVKASRPAYVADGVFTLMSAMDLMRLSDPENDR